MRIRSRVDALERRAAPTGECPCEENRGMDLLLCRDPSVPPPPLRVCGRCRRPVRRLILGPCPWAPGTEAHEPLSGLMDFYRRTVQTAYEPATMDTIVAMMAPPGAGYEPAATPHSGHLAAFDKPMSE